MAINVPNANILGRAGKLESTGLAVMADSLPSGRYDLI